MSRSTRRQFAKALAAVGAAFPLTKALAQSADKPCVPYREHLNEDDLKALAKQLQDRAVQIDALRKFQLKNSDEPDVTFSAGTRRW